MVVLKLLLIVPFPQLGLDDPQLLAQVIVPLALIDTFLDLLLNFRFQLENVQLPAQQDQRQLQPLHGMQLLQDLLLFGVVDGGVLGDIVGDEARVLGG